MLGFPLYKDTDLRRATAHQIYCFAIEVGFGANVRSSTLQFRNRTLKSRNLPGNSQITLASKNLNTVDTVDPGSLVDEHLLWWLKTILRIKEELEGTEKSVKELKLLK